MTKPKAPADPQSMEILDAYSEYLRRAGRSEKTMHEWRSNLDRIDRDLPYGIGQTTTDELATWLYRDEWSQNTRYTYYTCIMAFYRWAANPKDPWIDGNPAEELPKVKQPKGIARAVTDSQMQRVLTEAAEPYRTWAKLAAYQGLRCLEIAGLDREHITREQLIVVRGKGGRPRVHDTHEVVWQTIEPLPRGPIARLPDGDRATPHQISLRASVYFARRLGMPGVSLHRFRHWLGVTVQREYKDIRVTQRMLGHASLASTQIYTDATDEQQREARATLPRFDT